MAFHAHGFPFFCHHPGTNLHKLLVCHGTQQASMVVASSFPGNLQVWWPKSCILGNS